MQLISRRYIGNKAKLLEWIFSKIKDNVQGESFFDVFAGTGSVAEKALNNFKTIIVNDILVSNEIIYEALGRESVRIDFLRTYQEMITKFSDIKEDNYFSQNYGNKYFGINDAKKIGYIRELLENDYRKGTISDREFKVLLA